MNPVPPARLLPDYAALHPGYTLLLRYTFLRTPRPTMKRSRI
jgi:hypothetical protein